MFDPASRYYALKTLNLHMRDGRIVAYSARRLLPDGQRLPVLLEVRVQEGDRLDLIAARTLGDPAQFWRVCDANNAMNPLELLESPGALLRVPVPQPE